MCTILWIFKVGKCWCNVVLSCNLSHFFKLLYWSTDQYNNSFSMLNTTSMIAYGTPRVGKPSSHALVLGDSNRWRGSDKYFSQLNRSIYSTMQCIPLLLHVKALPILIVWVWAPYSTHPYILDQTLIQAQLWLIN